MLNNIGLPGILLIAMRGFVFLWFSYATYTTYKNYKGKRTFFCRFYVIFCLWIILLPIQAGFAFGVIPLWDRAKVRRHHVPYMSVTPTLCSHTH